MNFYVLLTFIMVIFLISHREYPLRVGVTISFVLFFLAAFRGVGVGHDTANYTDIAYIEQRANSSLSSLLDFADVDTSIEFLSNFLNLIVVKLGLSGQWVVIFYAIIMIVFVYLSCKRMALSPTYVMAFFVVLGIYFYSLSACRQICAVSVILYAMTYLKEPDKKSLYFFFWIVIAIMLHAMSFVSLPLYFVRKIPSTFSFNKIAWTVLILSLFLTIIKIDFLNQLSVLADSDHFTTYMEKYGESSVSIFSLLGCWVETGCLFYFFLLKKHSDTDQSITAFDYLFLF
ncbi:MAG: EpsG family protein, partial [Bacteroidaceae bacterium]|nr:EpsG family protein [Bacteroidaceae bacterium]